MGWKNHYPTLSNPHYQKHADRPNIIKRGEEEWSSVTIRGCVQLGSNKRVMVEEKGGGGSGANEGCSRPPFFRPLIEQPLDCYTMAAIFNSPLSRWTGGPLDSFSTPSPPRSSMDSGANSAPIWSAYLTEHWSHCDDSPPMLPIDSRSDFEVRLRDPSSDWCVPCFVRTIVSGNICGFRDAMIDFQG